jgi:hypothetical protein
MPGRPSRLSEWAALTGDELPDGLERPARDDGFVAEGGFAELYE